MLKKEVDGKLLIGRYEWCELPFLKIPAIKAKIDTGAKTSALHAFNIKTHKVNGKTHVKFDIHPLQRNDVTIVRCDALVIDERFIMSSNGHREQRYVISTPLRLGDREWDIEVTLSNRDPLSFRMLLGREALSHHVLVDTGLICKQGRMAKSKLRAFY